MSKHRYEFRHGFYCRIRYQRHYPYVWGPLGQGFKYYLPERGNAGDALRRYKVPMKDPIWDTPEVCNIWVMIWYMWTPSQHEAADDYWYQMYNSKD